MMLRAGTHSQTLPPAQKIPATSTKTGRHHSSHASFPAVKSSGEQVFGEPQSIFRRDRILRDSIFEPTDPPSERYSADFPAALIVDSKRRIVVSSTSGPSPLTINESTNRETCSATPTLAEIIMIGTTAF